MNHESRYPFATQKQLTEGAVPVDSVGHLLHDGDAMTCMCCGTDGVVSAEDIARGNSADEGWNFDGSQWVRTPEWLTRLRERALKAERERDEALRPLRTLLVLVRGIEPVAKLLAHLEKTESYIGGVTPGDNPPTTVEGRAEALLAMLTAPSKPLDTSRL